MNKNRIDGTHLIAAGGSFVCIICKRVSSVILGHLESGHQEPGAACMLSLLHFALC